MIESFADWQSRYLDALRRGDAAAAAALVDEALGLRTQMFSGIVPSLAAIRPEVDAEILGLNDAITELIADIRR